MRILNLYLDVVIFLHLMLLVSKLMMRMKGHIILKRKSLARMEREKEREREINDDYEVRS